MKETDDFRKRPPRLERVYQCFDVPMYYVTFCTMWRQRLLANEATHEDFRSYVVEAENHGIAVGRYVILPDHVHLFVRGHQSFVLGRWVGGLKRRMSLRLKPTARSGKVWQTGFFDHLMRSKDSYSEKWDYVRMNPVRAELVSTAREWPFQGEIVKMPL